MDLYQNIAEEIYTPATIGDRIIASTLGLPMALFGFVAQHVEYTFTNPDSSQYKPREENLNKLAEMVNDYGRVIFLGKMSSRIA